MPFDFTIAVAKLDLGSGTDRPDLDGLRSRYPELDFVFDLLEAKVRETENIDIERRDEKREIARAHESIIDDLECRIQDMRFAFAQIRELTVDAHITEIVEDIL